MSMRHDFAEALAMPAVATCVDPELARGRAGGIVHDASWVVELAIDRRPIGCILDGTRDVPDRDAARLELLGQLLPVVAPLAALRATDQVMPEAPVWMRAWQGEHAVVVDSRHDADTLARLCVSCGLGDDPRPQVVLVVAGAATSLVSRRSLAALREHLPQVRPLVLSIAPPPADVLARLAASNGGYRLVERRDIQPAPAVWRGITIEIDRARDVELAVHAEDVERMGDTWRVAGQPLAGDQTTELRVHAVTPHVDARVFAVHARGRRLDLPLAFGVLHDAHRERARPLAIRR
ncbi:MAG: hypothetical protein WKG01_17985 [Kofleriaceae bacterium]